MRPLTARMILEIWERGEHGDPAALSVALPEMSPWELAELPLGTLDNLLLRLREQTLGPTLNCRTSCPKCSVTADFVVDVHDIADLDAGDSALRDARDSPLQEYLLEADGASVRFRLPTGADLALAAGSPSVETARDVLLQSCILGAVVNGSDCPPDGLSPDLLDGLSERIESLDPMAELPLALQCSNCDNEWQPLLEIGSFVWAELSALARRLMNDVETLARFYGWSEHEILDMTATRRQYYLEQIS